MQIAVTKGNHCPPEAFVPIWLRRGEDGELTEVALTQVNRGGIGEKEIRALELLKATTPDGDTTLAFWRAECVAKGAIKKDLDPRAQEKAMERLRANLKAAGLVETPGRGLWRPSPEGFSFGRTDTS